MSERKAVDRIAIHSTHEAAEKIAGIGAVLDGILPQREYRDVFPASLLVGAYPFPEGRHPLKETLFDSASPGVESELAGPVRESLRRVAEENGVRILFGRRAVGTRGSETAVDVLLASPAGIRRSKVDIFRHAVRDRFRFDLGLYEDNYPALESAPDTSLERLLRYYDDSRRGGSPPPYPPDAPPETVLQDQRGLPFYGGVPFRSERVAGGTDRLAVFPAIRGLDSFAGFDKMNAYLVELQFYFYAASPLWQATRTLLSEWYRPAEFAFFAHDWLGVPLFWALKLQESLGGPRLTTSIYFAHEARIARLLVEGTVKDRTAELRARCHPDGHDVSFYSYLSRLETATPPPALPGAFPEVWRSWGEQAFDDVFYHAINRQAEHFDRVVAVGLNVKRETELILRGAPRAPKVSLCPNGVPDFTAPSQDIQDPAKILEMKVTGQREARDRIVEFCRDRFDFEPEVIFTAVNRCELSKAPWRNVDFFQAFLRSPQGQGKKALFVWLSRPKPLPTPEQLLRWKEWRWPLEHRPIEEGGDLRREEIVLWEMIRRLNSEGEGRCKVLYINQFGWSKDRLGALDPGRSTFLDLRLGTDVEIGLSIYEPFGIAPLEPFSSGAVCVLSDASGCALHLGELAKGGRISEEGFVIGRFASRPVEPSQVDRNRLRAIEAEVYVEIAAEVSAKLARPRAERLAAAQRALEHLSWATATRYLLEAVAAGR